jgi:GDP-L-fucose synthase
MSIKLLICGGSGFIGKNLTSYFSKNRNFKVYSTYFKKKPIKKIKNVTYIRTDLRNFSNCVKITKNIDVLIQAAATTSGSKDIINKPYFHVTDNAVMNSYLLRASFENKIKHFIFTSCTVMYENSSKYLSENQLNEKKIFKNYYGVANTKLYVEKMCKFYSDISETKFTIIRHSNIYGPGDKFDLDKGHFIGSSIVKFSKNKEITIFGSGTEKRDFLYINDFLFFVSKVLKFQKKKYNIYNCSYGRSFSIKDIIIKLDKIFSLRKKIIFLRKKKNLKVDILVSSKKAYKELNWFPKVKIDEGLKKTIVWYNHNEKFL